jgi:hypothetical protein
VQVSTSFSDLQEFGSKIIGPHIATERPSAPVRPYAPGMRKNQYFVVVLFVMAPVSQKLFADRACRSVLTGMLL